MTYAKKLFIQWNMLFAELVLLAGVFHFSQIQSEGLQIAYFPWLLSLSVSLLINTLLRARQAPINLVIVMNGFLACTAGVLGQQSLILTEESFFVRAFFFLLVASTTAHGAILVEEEPKQHLLVLYLDVLVIGTILLMVLQHIDALENIEALIPLSQIACAGTLLSLVFFRLQLPGHNRSRSHRFQGGLLFGIFIILLLAIAWFAASHSQTASTGIIHAAVSLKDLLVGVLLFLIGILGRFLVWLIQLFPVREEEFLLPEAQPDLVLEEIAVESSVSGGIFLLFLLLAALLAGILFLFWKLRGKRWKKQDRQPAETRTEQRKSHWKTGFGALWKKLWGNVSFQIRYLKNRKTATGLFVWTERKLRRKAYRRATGESPSSWLRRLSQDSCCMPSAANVGTAAESDSLYSHLDSHPLLTLADLLEKQYYRRTREPLPKGFFKSYRQTISHLYTSSQK